MKKLPLAAGFIVGLALFFVVVVIAINAIDAPLSPASRALVDEIYREVKPSEGSDYLIGLTAPANEDPFNVGRKIREEARSKQSAGFIGYKPRASAQDLQVTAKSSRCDGVTNRPVFCGKDWYLAHAADVEALTKENRILLSRFDKLTTLATFDTELPARYLVSTNALDVQYLLQIKQDNWGLKWAKGDKNDVIKEWAEANRFFHRWLEATPVSLLEVVVVLHLLETQKQFALEILKSDSKATALFDSERLLTLKPTVSFERLMKKVSTSEFNFFYSVARVRPTVGTLRGANLGEALDFESIVNKLPVPLLKRNTTLNAYVERTREIQNDPCVIGESSCESSARKLELTLVNPIGNIFLSGLTTTPVMFEKMYLKYSSLSELQEI